MDEETAPMVSATKRNSARNSASSQSDVQSERSSILGTSVTYEEHLNAHALDMRNTTLNRLKMLVTLYSIGFIAVSVIAMLANGIFIGSTIATTGCLIGLNWWYIGLSAVFFVGTVVQSARLVHFRWHN